jgi:hypothetical protein
MVFNQIIYLAGINMGSAPNQAYRVAEVNLPDRLVTYLSANPHVPFQQAWNELGKEYEGNQEVAGTDVESLRAGFNRRAEAINLRYHLKVHPEHSRKRLDCYLENLAPDVNFSDETIARLRYIIDIHDDAHSGHTYRQLIAEERGLLGENLSNEEFMLLILLVETCPVFNQVVLDDLCSLGRSTSFGQTRFDLKREFEGQPEIQARLLRDCPKDSPEKLLLGLADVGYFEKGWEHFINRSLDLVAEKGVAPTSLDAWFQSNIGFLEKYVMDLIGRLEGVLKEEYRAKLISKLNAIVGRFSILLSSPEGAPGRTALKARLDEASSST